MYVQDVLSDQTAGNQTESRWAIRERLKSVDGVRLSAGGCRPQGKQGAPTARRGNPLSLDNAGPRDK